MENLFASASQPEICPYCGAGSTVFNLSDDSLYKAPFRGLPYEPIWRCSRCGGNILKSYSGGVFWGKKVEGEEVVYRFLLTLRGREVSFLDHHYLYRREIGEEQRKLFYDIIEILPLSGNAPVENNGWSLHLSFPSENKLIHYNGNPEKGVEVMQEALMVLGIEGRVLSPES
ncbi:MAG: hypothetical protein R6U46_14170 [Marinilabilia sp.]